MGSRWRRLGRRCALAMGAAAVVAAGTAIVGPVAAHAATAGTAMVIDTTTGQPPAGLVSSTSPFELFLPMGAACTSGSGDTIYGYAVDNALDPDPGALMFDGPGIINPLIDTQGNDFVQEPTEPTGAIPETPAFDWNQYAGFFSADNQTGLLYPGTWNVGIACVNSVGVVDNYWNAQFSLAADPTSSSDFLWSIPGVPITPLTKTTVTSSPNPSTPGQPVTYTASVIGFEDGQNPELPPPGGTVTFWANSSEPAGCSAVPLDAGGQATCTITYGNPGTHNILAVYSGFSGTTPPLPSTASGVVTQTVGPPAALPEGRPWMLAVGGGGILAVAVGVLRGTTRKSAARTTVG